MQENTPEYEAYLIRLAETNIANGVIEEPRIFCERLQTTKNSGPVNADPAVFMNGEKFPVRILYMTFNVAGRNLSLQAAGTAGGLLGENYAQSVGLRLRFHDQFYMRPEYSPLGNWGTQINASSDANNLFTSSHKTWRPVVLSARDSLEVRARAAPGVFGVLPDPLEPTPDAPWRVTATATGVGIFSKRPYFLSSTLRLEDLTVRQFDGLDFKNDGAEPILITDMSYSAIVDDIVTPNVSPAPIAPLVEVGCRQIGNGTNASWVVNGPGQPNLAPIPNWGTYSGRALVHRFPGQGLIWEPGEGIDLSVTNLGYAGPNGPDNVEVTIDTTVSLVGYIAIQ